MRLRLTPRQQYVLIYLALGLSVKETARKMAIGTRTVEWHIAAIRQRLQANTTPEMIYLACVLGYLPTDGNMCIEGADKIVAHNLFYGARLDTDPLQ